MTVSCYEKKVYKCAAAYFANEDGESDPGLLNSDLFRFLGKLYMPETMDQDIAMSIVSLTITTWQLHNPDKIAYGD